MSSTKETKKHIRQVQLFLLEFTMELYQRYMDHDKSKLENGEKEYFDKYTPLLKNSTYGTDEYFDILKKLKPALDHHYSNNRHHPEYHEDGINGMNLVDIIEMFFDWMAAVKRHENGNIHKSIDFNKNRFKISEQLCQIFENTIPLFDED